MLTVQIMGSGQWANKIVQDIKSDRINFARNLTSLFQKYPNHIFVGIYNKRDDVIYTLPTIEEKIWLLTDCYGYHHAGWEVIENKDSQPRFRRGEAISPHILNKFNSDKAYAPRLFSHFETDDGVTRSASHDYVVNFIDEKDNIEEYYGFSMHQDKTNPRCLNVVWVSATLNTRDNSGLRARNSDGSLLMIPGAKMDNQTQSMIINNLIKQGFGVQ